MTPGPLSRVSNRTLTTPWPAPCTQPWPNSGWVTSSPIRHPAVAVAVAGSGIGFGANSTSCCSSSGNSDSCSTSLRPENPTPRRRIGPISRGSSSRRCTVAASAPASAVAYGRVAERVSVDMSAFLSFTVTVRAPRPSRASRRWACSAIGAAASRSASSVMRSAAKVDSALICLASARSVTGRSSMPRAHRWSAGPMVAPRMLADSASVNAASCPTVSTPSRCSLSSATGPIPHSRRTGNPSRSARSSSGRITRTPSGLASPEAILAICFPEPAPTEATSPVCSRTRRRRCAQNSCT